MPLERLEREITELASHIHAATCRWLGLVAEFDRRERLGAVGLPELCGMDLLALLDLARRRARARARRAPPGGAAADPRRVLRGRLSYSKVRALTRVDERRAGGGAAQPRAARDGLAARAHGPGLPRRRPRRAGGRGGRPQRYVTWAYADDGSLLLRARLPAEEGAVVLEALEASVGAPRGRDGGCDLRGDARPRAS